MIYSNDSSESSHNAKDTIVIATTQRIFLLDTNIIKSSHPVMREHLWQSDSFDRCGYTHTRSLPKACIYPQNLVSARSPQSDPASIVCVGSGAVSSLAGKVECAHQQTVQNGHDRFNEMIRS